MKFYQIVVVGSAVALALSSVTGCALMPKSHACPGWAGYDSPSDAMEDAQLVVVGEAAGVTGTTQLFGAQSAVHEVSVEQVLKGKLESGASLQVISVSPSCGGGAAYPDGDPLDVNGQQIFFLTQIDTQQEWRTLSPQFGITEFTGDVEASLDAWR